SSESSSTPSTTRKNHGHHPQRTPRPTSPSRPETKSARRSTSCATSQKKQPTSLSALKEQGGTRPLSPSANGAPTYTSASIQETNNSECSTNCRPSLRDGIAGWPLSPSPIARCSAHSPPSCTSPPSYQSSS